MNKEHLIQALRDALDSEGVIEIAETNGTDVTLSGNANLANIADHIIGVLED